MIVFVLSSDEKLLLRDHFQQSPIALIRLKAQTIMLRDRGMKLEEIGEILFRTVRTIARWIKDFSVQRIASLFSGMVDNEHASKLTREQKAEIKQVIGQPPDQFGIPKEFWDVPKLKEYVSTTFGVVYECDQSYHFLLKFSGLSFKYPDKLSPRRNEEQIIKRIAEVKTEIIPFLQDPNCLVFTSDETRVQLESEIRKAWLVKGKRTIIQTQRSKEHQNYLGFLDQKTGACQVFEIERGKQVCIISALEQLLAKYPDQQVCVIWDNATCHKGKLIREKLKKGQSLERLHLIAFPPYAPDHNPIEHVWQYAKKKIANRSNQVFEVIKQAFLDSITQRTFDYRI
ncbi:MAG TPA: IS630 family transposase [Candidatus Pacebacteria bacterium]|nr:IS630 family transposase [Candidatus Paceibacterota bacterium]